MRLDLENPRIHSNNLKMKKKYTGIEDKILYRNRTKLKELK